MTTPLGAARHERTADRDGHEPPPLTTRVGATEPRVPPDVVEIDRPAPGRDGGQEHRADPVLVQACLDGDERAWETLVERFGRLVYSIPRRHGLAAEDADDIFQVVFTTLFRRLHALRDQTRLSSWLITTTYRECWRLGKQTARQIGLDEDASIVDAGAPPADEVVRWEREQQARQALRCLDDRCRDLLTALFLESTTPSYEGIGARLAMPVGSIGPTRARCFRKLEAALHEIGFESKA